MRRAARTLPEIPHSRPWITEAEEAAVREQLRSGRVASGPAVAAFEEELAARLGLPGAVATPSGTRALVLALEALGVAAGHEVVVPTYVCDSVAEAVRATGARPVFADAAPDWQGDPEAVARKLTPRTAAVVLVHHLGIRTDADPFARLGVPLIEDFCQTLDPETFRWAGDAAVFSFHATKCLTTGEGGMATARDPRVLRRLREGRRRGAAMGAMTDLQAALGRAQLARSAEIGARRRAIADRYLACLPAPLTAAFRRVRVRSMAYRVLLTGLDFERAAAVGARHGVAIRRGVDALLHRQAGLPDADFPVATALFDATVSIPAHPSLSDEEVERVIACVLDAAGER